MKTIVRKQNNFETRQAMNEWAKSLFFQIGLLHLFGLLKATLMQKEKKSYERFREKLRTDERANERTKRGSI